MNSDWYEVKLLVQHASGISMDALHVIAGVFLQFALALIFRVPLSRWSVWISVLAFELVNEVGDLHTETWPHLGMQYGEGLKDVVLTMVLPTVVLAASMLKPSLFSGEAGSSEKASRRTP